MQYTLAALSLLAVFLVPATGYALLGQFIPHIIGYTGEIDINFISDNNESKSPKNVFSRHDNVFRETVELTSYGYVYHPRFMTFLASVGGGFQQEHYVAPGVVDQGFRNSTVEDYELRTLFLPEHPYNLELFTLRKNIFIRGGFVQGSTTVDVQSGANFNYSEKPWSVLLSYLHDSLSAFGVTTTTNNYNANASYVRGAMVNALGYIHTDSSASVNSTNSLNSFYYFNVLKQSWLRFQSHVNANYSTQRSGLLGQPLDIKLLLWTEQLELKLPLNFVASGYYNFNSNTNITAKGTSEEQKSFQKTQNPMAQLTHTLFQSLTSTYQYNYILSESSGGSVKSATNVLSFSYAKKIPWGILNAGVFVADTSTKTVGSPVVLNEVQFAQKAPFPNNFFVLKQQFVNQSSIAIQVKDPNNILVDVPPADYQAIPSGNTFKIFINLLPPEVTSTRPADYLYEFVVSYSLFSNASFDTKTNSYTLQLRLFDGMVTPYAGYETIKQKLLSGSIVGGPQSSISRTYGIILLRMPWSLTSEYESIDSTSNPIRRFKSELAYRRTFIQTLYVDAKIYYWNEKHLPSPFVEPYTDRTYGTTVSLIKTFPEQNLDAQLGGSYVLTYGLSNGSSYSVNSVLHWKVGKLDLDVGASITRSESRPSVSSAFKQEQDSEYYYLKLRRKLF